MEQLEQIPIGQQANDGTGDPLRNGMAKVNANFTKVQTGVDAVELTAMNAAQAAAEAKTTAEAAIPAVQKGMAGGVAPLDATGKVPAAHLPELAEYIPVEEKGAAGGVAPLDSSGKVPAINLPAAEDSIPLSQKGQPGGVATLDTGGKVPAGQLPPIPTGPPVGSVAWWPLRSSIPAGQIPADGQTVSRATFPDLAAMVAAGTVPVVSEADWLADPLKRGAYTLGDGSATIRMPDYNGKASGSIGALFMRGDGSLSSGVDGSIQRDALQNIAGSLDIGWGRNIARMVANPSGNTTGPFRSVVDGGNGYLVEGSARVASDYASSYTFDASRVARTATETRPSNVAGVWTVQAFGAVTNPGSADAAQLASDYAALNAGFQTLNADFQTLNASFQTLRTQVFGVGQSLQNVLANRTAGVVYTNSTGRPIVVYVEGDTNSSAGGNIGIQIGGIYVTRALFGVNGIRLSANAVIPPGASYQVVVSAITFTAWLEYR